ncbi:MAG: LysR family transcriptional regulator [Granulosicoccaceae bacterium]
MNIKALRAFRATVSEGSLAGAARIIHLSQPAVSRLISGLEAELHLELFNRMGRNLTPTAEALIFFREAGRILNNLDEIPKIAAEIRAGKTNSLRIVAMPRIAQSLVSPAVADFIVQYPETSISLDIRARREANKWLAGREYDIGVGALPVEHPEIETELLLRVRAQAVIPKNNPLSEKESITVDDLYGQPIIRLMHGLLLRDQLDDMFTSAGIVPNVVCEVASSQLACSLAADGAGITIADELVASQVEKNSFTLVPIEPERWMSFGLLFPKNMERSESRDMFVETLKDRGRNLSITSAGIKLS